MSNPLVNYIDERELYNYDTECPICFEKIGQTNTITTVCGHTFHASCIIQNLYVSDSCPMCRHIIDENKLNDSNSIDWLDVPDGINGIEGLTDNDIDSFIETLTNETGSSTRMAGEIIDLIQNSHTHGNVQQLEPVAHVEQIENIIRNNMTYFGFDLVDILRNIGEWSDDNNDIVMASENESENTREDFAHGAALEM